MPVHLYSFFCVYDVVFFWNQDVNCQCFMLSINVLLKLKYYIFIFSFCRMFLQNLLAKKMFFLPPCCSMINKARANLTIINCSRKIETPKQSKSYLKFNVIFYSDDTRSIDLQTDDKSECLLFGYLILKKSPIKSVRPIGGNISMTLPKIIDNLYVFFEPVLICSR